MITEIILGVSAVLGIGGHLSAKETNEKAQQLATEAQNLYNTAKNSLEQAQKETEAALVALGNRKKAVLENSMEQFLRAYERVKAIKVSESIGLDEISNFKFEQQDALQLQEMSSIYQSAFTSGATGAATGAAIALATSGALPIVTGVLSTAGSALAAGQIGAAVGMTGSAFSFGLAMTPLQAVVAPVVLFTGISSSMKADENLEKAQTMYSEAKAATEKMQISETLCRAIQKRATMFNSLLKELNNLFADCAYLLDQVTLKKSSSGNATIDVNTLTEEELKLIAVTRALAGAVKAVIDTPMLSSDGTLTAESEDIYDSTKTALPAFRTAVGEVKTSKLHVRLKPKSAQRFENKESTPKELDNISTYGRNIAVLVFSMWMAKIYYLQVLPWRPVIFPVFAITNLLLMNSGTKSSFFKLLKKICYFMIAFTGCTFLYSYGPQMVWMNGFWAYIIGDGVLFFIIAGKLSIMKNKGKILSLLTRVFSVMFFTCIALAIYKILFAWIGLPFAFSMIVSEILLFPFAIIGAFLL